MTRLYGEKLNSFPEKTGIVLYREQGGWEGRRRQAGKKEGRVYINKVVVGRGAE